MSDHLRPPDPAPPLLATPREEPCPWDWAGCTGDGATQRAEQLGEFVAYLNARYAWGTEHTVPPCWAAHGARAFARRSARDWRGPMGSAAGDEHQLLGIGMEGGVDELARDVRPVDWAVSMWLMPGSITRRRTAIGRVAVA